MNRFVDTSMQAIEQAEREFGHGVILDKPQATSPEEAAEETTQLNRAAVDILVSEEGGSDFPEIPIPIADYTKHPGILGCILLMQDPRTEEMRPVIIEEDTESPSPGAFKIIRFAAPYVPNVGVTDGINWALSLGKETSAPTFGSADHGHGARDAFEGGHFGVMLASGRDTSLLRDLQRNGDDATHKFLKPSIPRQLGRLGLVTEQAMPEPPIHIDPAKYPPNTFFPLHWHETLGETESGVIRADFENPTRIAYGRTVIELGDRGLDVAKRNIDLVVRGAHEHD